jgi:hypothetical protein
VFIIKDIKWLVKAWKDLINSKDKVRVYDSYATYMYISTINFLVFKSAWLFPALLLFWYPAYYFGGNAWAIYKIGMIISISLTIILAGSQKFVEADINSVVEIKAINGPKTISYIYWVVMALISSVFLPINDDYNIGKHILGEYSEGIRLLIAGVILFVGSFLNLWASNLKKIRYWGKIEAIWIDAIYIGLAALAVLLKLYIDSVDEYERNASVIYKKK